MKSQKDQMDGLKKMNAETLRLQQETAAKDAALEIMYQDQYTERLRKQEEDRGSALAKMKEKQQAQEKFGKAMGPTKRYMPDEIIEKNFQAGAYTRPHPCSTLSRSCH